MLLTEEGLLLQMAGAEAPAALQQTVGLRGTMIPVYWEETTREEAVQRLGFIERDGELAWAKDEPNRD
ncbi:MAG: hypothetical protein KGJ86_04810 [Chloroflexota bacterium]|nr:hypothetical protein [Chloroflexota bacterium]